MAAFYELLEGVGELPSVPRTVFFTDAWFLSSCFTLSLATWLGTSAGQVLSPVAGDALRLRLLR